jgi:Domain of unknown function (DUF4956)
MSQYAMLAADVVAVLVLTFALFVPRHGRRELVVAFLGVNIGVVAVTAALASGTVGAGLGLGLFGVLSIIRLRSEELAQHEVAYYFAALALGLIGGLLSAPSWLAGGLMAGVLLSIYIGDHPRVVGVGRTQEVLVDRAFTDMGGLVAHLEGLLGAHVDNVSVRRTDLVNDTTLVRVRYSPDTKPAVAAAREHERIGHLG